MKIAKITPEKIAQYYDLVTNKAIAEGMEPGPLTVILKVIADQLSQEYDVKIEKIMVNSTPNKCPGCEHCAGDLDIN